MIGSSDKGSGNVSALRQALSASGIVTSELPSTDGWNALFTEQTAADVVQFQAKYGIRQTGYVGPATRAKLNALYGCSNTQPATVVSSVPLVSSWNGKSGSFSPGANQTVTGQYLRSITSISLVSQDGNKTYGLEWSPTSDTSIGILMPRSQQIPAGKYYLYLNNPVGRSAGTLVDVATLSTTSTNQPSITVTYPNGGEQFVLGKNIDFRTTWSSSYLSGDVSVYLNFSDGGTCLLGTAPVSQGYFPVSLTNADGSGYKCPNISKTVTAGKYKMLVASNVPDPAGSVLGVHGASAGYFNVTVSSSTVVIAPTITSIQSAGNPVGTISMNQKASIYGTGLSGNITVWIGSQDLQTVSVTSTSDSYAEFTVPSRSQSATVSIQVTDRYGVRSNFYQVNLLAPTPTPTCLDVAQTPVSCNQDLTKYGVPAGYTSGQASWTLNSCTQAVTYTGGCSAPACSDVAQTPVSCNQDLTKYGVPSGYTSGQASWTMNSCTSAITYTGGCSAPTTTTTSCSNVAQTPVSCNQDLTKYGVPAGYTSGQASWTLNSCTQAVTYTGGCSAPSVSFLGGVTQTASALNAFESTAKSASIPTTTVPAFTHLWNVDLQIGSPYASDVTALQTALARVGVYNGKITGGFYNQTFAAVKAFQQKYGIEATGFVGPATRAELNVLFAK